MIQRSHLYATFSRRIVDAVYARRLGPLAGAALAAAACGGNVAVEGGTSSGTTGGAGGATGSSSGTTSAGGAGGSFSTTTASTGTGAGGSCNAQVTPPNELVQGCVDMQGGACPDVSATSTLQEVAAAAGFCTPSGPKSCCGQSTMIQLVCGPALTPAGTCCYQGVVEPNYICGTGRPFTVAEGARTAARRERRDWCAPRSPDAAAALDPATRRALAAAWAREASYEHASIASFARLSLELLAVGAPPELVRDAQRAMGDEIRHAELCFALASGYAGVPVGPDALPFDGALGRVSLADVAAAVVREGCIGETLAALAAAEARDLATDPAVRAALDEIATDEADHAAMSWRLAAWAHDVGGDDVRAAIAAAFAASVDPSFSDEGEDVALDAFHANGRLTAAELRAAASRALAEVVRPAAAALLSARPAVAA
jgi:hypothetical protein